jgi:hypothetical protein
MVSLELLLELQEILVNVLHSPISLLLDLPNTFNPLMDFLPNLAQLLCPPPALLLLHPLPYVLQPPLRLLLVPPNFLSQPRIHFLDPPLQFLPHPY